jgi:CheY-like chemotaxis protein
VALVSGLLRAAGFRVVNAPSGVAALEALQKAGDASQAISLLVTDLGMPGMTGNVFAARMKKTHSNLKVLYVTSNAEILFQGQRELGSNEALLTKPVSSALLREAIALLLSPPA